MNLEVKLFARARDIAGADRVSVNVSVGATVADLRTALAVSFPELQPLVPSLLFAVGSDYAGDGVTLEASAEIACFPPVSGG